MPQVERFEGRVRFSQKMADEQSAGGDHQQDAAAKTGRGLQPQAK